MRQAGVRGAKRRGKPRRTTNADPQAQRRPDLVERDFTAERPNELWVADLTHLRCWKGVLYLPFIIDVFSRMVVGWQLAGHMRKELVLDALRTAIGMRAPGADFALVHHSDQGSHTRASTTSRHSMIMAWHSRPDRSATHTTTRWPSLGWIP